MDAVALLTAQRTTVSVALHALSTVTEDDLDQMPDNRAHLARRPAYRTPDYLAEVQGMWNQTLAEVIALDIGHGRAHLGEAGLTKELARQNLDT